MALSGVQVQLRAARLHAVYIQRYVEQHENSESSNKAKNNEFSPGDFCLLILCAQRQKEADFLVQIRKF